MSVILYSNTLLTLAEANELLHDAIWTESSDDDKEAALIFASRKLDEAVPWLGVSAGEDQVMQWPREEFSYHDPSFNRTVTVAAGATPVRLRKAVAYLALHALQYPSAATPYAASYETLKLGPLEVSDSSANSSIPAIPGAVLDLLTPLSREPGYGRQWWRAW